MTEPTFETEADARRTHLRRRAIAEGWSVTTLAIADDLADTARESGTHALRTEVEQASRLGLGVATIHRHRRQLLDGGAFVSRRAGGRGRGAAVLDLGPVGHADSVAPASVDDAPAGRPSPAPNRASQPALNTMGDPAISPSIAHQQHITNTPEADVRPLSSSPTSTSPEASVHTDADVPVPELVDQIAAAYEVNSDVAEAMLAIVKADPQVRNPGAWLRHVGWDSTSRVKERALAQAAAAQDAQRLAYDRAQAAQVLGPCPPEGHHDNYRWRVAAAAYNGRHQRPARWKAELDGWRQTHGGATDD